MIDSEVLLPANTVRMPWVDITIEHVKLTAWNERKRGGVHYNCIENIIVSSWLRKCELEGEGDRTTQSAFSFSEWQVKWKGNLNNEINVVTGVLVHKKVCYKILSPEFRRKLLKCIGNSQN